MVAASFGTNFAAYVVLFSLGGYFLDKRRGGGVLFTVLGFLFGLIGGMYELWKLVNTFEPTKPKRTSSKQDDD